MDFGEFIGTETGWTFIQIFSTLTASACLCGGVNLLGIKKIPPLFTFRKVIGIFLITEGATFILYQFVRIFSKS